MKWIVSKKGNFGLTRICGDGPEKNLEKPFKEKIC